MLEDMIAGNPRVPMHIHLKMGFMRSGKFAAKEVMIVASNGGRTVFSPPIMSTACYRVDTLYFFENLRARGYAVDTNTVPTGAFRGFGNAQMTFALETMIDGASLRLGIDPIELRKRNAPPSSGWTSVHGWEVGTSGLVECLEETGSMSGILTRRTLCAQTGTKRRGMGLAACNHVSGNKAFFPPFDGSASIFRIG